METHPTILQNKDLILEKKNLLETKVTKFELLWEQGFSALYLGKLVHIGCLLMGWVSFGAKFVSFGFMMSVGWVAGWGQSGESERAVNPH